VLQLEKTDISRCRKWEKKHYFKEIVFQIMTCIKLNYFAKTFSNSIILIIFLKKIIFKAIN